MRSQKEQGEEEIYQEDEEEETKINYIEQSKRDNTSQFYQSIHNNQNSMGKQNLNFSNGHQNLRQILQEKGDETQFYLINYENQDEYFSKDNQQLQENNNNDDDKIIIQDDEENIDEPQEMVLVNSNEQNEEESDSIQQQFQNEISYIIQDIDKRFCKEKEPHQESIAYLFQLLSKCKEYQLSPSHYQLFTDDRQFPDVQSFFDTVNSYSKSLLQQLLSQFKENQAKVNEFVKLFNLFLQNDTSINKRDQQIIENEVFNLSQTYTCDSSAFQSQLNLKFPTQYQSFQSKIQKYLNQVQLPQKIKGEDPSKKLKPNPQSEFVPQPSSYPLKQQKQKVYNQPANYNIQGRNNNNQQQQEKGYSESIKSNNDQNQYLSMNNKKNQLQQRNEFIVNNEKSLPELLKSYQQSGVINQQEIIQERVNSQQTLPRIIKTNIQNHKQDRERKQKVSQNVVENSEDCIHSFIIKKSLEIKKERLKNINQFNLDRIECNLKLKSSMNKFSEAEAQMIKKQEEKVDNLRNEYDQIFCELTSKKQKYQFFIQQLQEQQQQQLQNIQYQQLQQRVVFSQQQNQPMPNQRHI